MIRNQEIQSGLTARESGQDAPLNISLELYSVVFESMPAGFDAESLYDWSYGQSLPGNFAQKKIFPQSRPLTQISQPSLHRK